MFNPGDRVTIKPERLEYYKRYYDRSEDDSWQAQIYLAVINGDSMISRGVNSGNKKSLVVYCESFYPGNVDRDWNILISDLKLLKPDGKLRFSYIVSDNPPNSNGYSEWYRKCMK